MVWKCGICTCARMHLLLRRSSLTTGTAPTLLVSGRQILQKLSESVNPDSTESYCNAFLIIQCTCCCRQKSITLSYDYLPLPPLELVVPELLPASALLLDYVICFCFCCSVALSQLKWPLAFKCQCFGLLGRLWTLANVRRASQLWCTRH